MEMTIWHETNGLALLSGNTVDGKTVTSADLLPCFVNQPKHKNRNPACTAMDNAHTRDLESTSGVAAPPQSGLTPQTRFLKSSWPVPTSP
jgi:hypothetical protein